MADIDWKEAGIRVCGKGHQEARLPLSQEIGDAPVGYLQQRPAADTDTLFRRAFGTSLLEAQWTFTLVAAR
jgi:site-specific recombinase XerC